MSGKIGASIRSSYMSNDLYENMQYLLDEKNKNFSLFGCYAYKTLKAKKILESLDLEVLHKLNDLGFQANTANRFKNHFLLNNIFFLFLSIEFTYVFFCFEGT